MFEENYNKLVRKIGTPEPGAPDTCEYVIEECSELIQAIQHMKRKRDNAYQHVVNELADMYAVMDALCYHMAITETEINFYKQKLIDRYLNVPNDGRHVPEISLVNQTKED